MTNSEDIKRMRELENLLDYHSHRYYVENNPEISDKEFDMTDMGYELMQILCEKYPELISNKFGIELNYDEFLFDKLTDEQTISPSLSRNHFTISQIVGNQLSEESNNPIVEEEDGRQYKSIIDFPNFLMHILKLYYNQSNIKKISNLMKSSYLNIFMT